MKLEIATAGMQGLAEEFLAAHRHTPIADENVAWVKRLLDGMKHPKRVDLLQIPIGGPLAYYPAFEGATVLFLGAESLGTDPAEAELVLVRRSAHSSRLRGVMVRLEDYQEHRDTPALPVKIIAFDTHDLKRTGGYDRLDPWTLVLERPGPIRDGLTAAIRTLAAERWKGLEHPKGWDAVRRHRDRIAVLSAGKKTVSVQTPQALQHHQRVLNALREARLYTFPCARVQAVWREINAYVLDVTSGIREDDGAVVATKPHDPASKGRFLEHLVHPDRTANHEAIDALVANLPGLTELPFPTICILPEHPMMLGFMTCATLMMRFLDSQSTDEEKVAGQIDVQVAYFDGLLLTRAGDTFLILTYVDREGTERMTPLELRRHRGGFSKPAQGKDDQWLWASSLFPWLAYALVAIIGDCREFIVRVPTTSGSEETEKAAALRKRTPTHTPQAYYQLTLDDVVVVERLRSRAAVLGWVDEEGRKIRLHRGWSHRWDVPEHDRVYVRRGEAWDEREVGRLKKRGYTVYPPGTTLDDDDFARLVRRGHARPAPGEWLALLAIRVKDHQKGPEDKPYIPARRHVVAEERTS